ncbi:archaellum operon transcriptional activator EarA family protein [Candidatus Pyrohabitans sp.]
MPEMTPENRNHIAKVLWSFKRSRVRKETFKFLIEIHPNRSYPAEIAREIGSTPSNVKCALSGAPWGDCRFNASYSLLSLELVRVEEINGRRYYRATEKGLEIAKNLRDKF